MKPANTALGNTWHMNPGVLLALAGLLIGLGSGYWGRELLSQSEQARQYAHIQAQMSDIRLSASAAKTDVLTVRMDIDRETSAKLKEMAERNRRETDKVNQKLDVIMSDLTDIKVRLAQEH